MTSTSVIDPDAFANLLCDWCLEVRERDYVLLASTPLAAPLIRAVQRALISRGAWAPGVRIGLPGMAEDFYRLAPGELLDNFPPHDLAEMERIDAYLGIQAPENTRALADIDPAWINSNGKHNMPSGEVFTGPLEDSATGTIHFTVPSSPRGVRVEDVTLTFKNGKVTKATAGRGQHYLDAALATDAGARFLGELGIGTNAGIDRPTGSTLLDEDDQLVRSSQNVWFEWSAEDWLLAEMSNMTGWPTGND